LKSAATPHGVYEKDLTFIGLFVDALTINYLARKFIGSMADFDSDL
jgi:hypothetical protein